MLNTDIRMIRGIGDKKAKLLNKLGLFTLLDLLQYFPRAYQDRTKVLSIRDAPLTEEVCIEASPVASPVLSHIRTGLDLLKLRCSDGTGLLDLTFFNQRWLKDRLKPGETYVFYGKVQGTPLRKEMVNPLFESVQDTPRITRRITPVYRLTAGVGQLLIADAVREGLALLRDDFPEPIPESVRASQKLAFARYAYENIHAPASAEALELSRRRLIFEELFLLTLALRLIKSPVSTPGPVMSAPVTEFLHAIPYRLTGAQSRAVGDILCDLSSGRPMNRLIQGDVGSGKTLVAAAAAFVAVKSGFQAALMAPTEILAAQHAEALSPLFFPLGVRVGLLTGSMTPKQKRLIKQEIEAGEIDLVIGTHALLTEDVQYFNLGLVITDEQHRFGVKQRTALSAKGLNTHVLVMSATPIPRTLALILYGDLDISVIDELPPGRTPVETYTVDEQKRDRIHRFIQKLVGEGRQAYIVCPLVEDPEGLDDGRKAVEAYTKHLSEAVFPDLHIGYVHGKMPQRQKDAVMSDFVAGRLDILVATTVIEVGINVPNAALMVIENAERFGLSQLHQLRGRIGRGAHQSYCILFSEAKNEASLSRLQIMRGTTDGFLIAEEDLKLRGPGEFFGNRQHGMPKFRIADLATDTETLREAAASAIALLSEDPDLSAPGHAPLKEQVATLLDAIGR